ncbi:hypothetical protein POM88_000647 [Heracleum sosnowskyi]|uniref:Transposase n=1 Tax=Heracleum sosnowskyi TaxID=360622 RepID=A0AAD8N9L0_9APIA|nr:hypothetical protein POM88_000647 [Heracleum sosnowskyi]
MTDDPCIRLLNRLYARKRKELKEIEKVKNVEVVEERMDNRSMDDLLSFINGGDGDSKCFRTTRNKNKNRRQKDQSRNTTSNNKNENREKDIDILNLDGHNDLEFLVKKRLGFQLVDLEFLEKKRLEQSPLQTPLTLQNAPRETPEPNLQNESSIADSGVWKVGSMHNDGRLQVEIIRGVLQPSGKCSSMTSGIMYERLEPRGFTWKEVSEETKKFYFEEFKKYVVLREPEHLVIRQDLWKSWIEDWKSPEFQAKSKIKKSNCMGGIDGDGPYPQTHTGGSKSHSSYVAYLAEKYKRKLNASDVYSYVHTKDHDEKTWVDEKSTNVFTLRAERSQPIEGSSIPQPVDENQLFYEGVGGRIHYTIDWL